MSCVVMTTNCGWTDGATEYFISHSRAFRWYYILSTFDGGGVVLIGQYLLFSSINYYLYRMWANSGFVTAVVGGR